MPLSRLVSRSTDFREFGYGFWHCERVRTGDNAGSWSCLLFVPDRTQLEE